MNNIVKSFERKHFQGLKLPGVVIYYNTTDFPGKYVGRVWDLGRESPTETAIVTENLEHLREKINKAGFQMVIMRDKNDDPVVAETWI